MKNKKKTQQSTGDRISRKIVKNEVRKAQTELLVKIDDLDAQKSFARRVLDRSNSIITYLTPIYSDSGLIKDFLIDYINDRMEAETDESSIDIIGKKMSEYHPANFDNGIFEEFVLCMETSEHREFQKKQFFGDVEFWFSHKVTRLDDGIIVFSKNTTKEKEYELQLDVQNKLLSEAEYVANIGSYKWKLDEDIMQYSDNAYRLFGYEPGEFSPTLSKFYSLVHPDDRERLEVNSVNVMASKERSETLYRIVCKDKKIKTIRSVGEFYKKDGSWYLVGVLADVTKQVVTERQLIVRNQELRRSNDELEAFNRIASHDLQEPLRKIQMFVSRLEEDSIHSLTARSQGYLNKVISSTERMRTLITNLLSYSKLDVVNERPENVDLNEVLADVKEDLAQLIEDTKAIIKADSLPQLVAIKFQMEQLFSNLIGNSLKYSNPDSTPVIKIKSKLLTNSDIEKSLALPHSSYVRIDFIDNGIGFDTEYQEKIFEIFQRLHTKNEYSGTGLGLAICRKIVETHNGAIFAKGTAGKGAVFTIYLPYSSS